ncbi:MAG: phage portal protein [Alphaproteobacteria bacterium]|nr:phage portal protein [Alphaproteobacteria bacterium]
MDKLTQAIKHQALYEGREYDGLAEFWQESDKEGKYVPVRMRRPSNPQRMARMMVGRVRGMLMGANTFPRLSHADPDISALLEWLGKELYRTVPNACTDALVQGAACITFGFVRGVLVVRHWKRNDCAPLFDESGSLVAVVVRRQVMVGDKSEDGRMILTTTDETWQYKAKDKWVSLPEKKIEHGFGFVPAVWVRPLDCGCGLVDGESLLEGVEPLSREHDYAFSQEGRGLFYTADPQVVISDEEPEKTAATLQKSPRGTWLIGKDGKAFFLEITGDGIQLLANYSERARRRAFDLARVVALDPEKLVGTAISGFALRMLYAPMIQLCDDLRPAWTLAINELCAKILFAARITGMGEKRIYLPKVEVLNKLPSLPTVDEMFAQMHPWLEERLSCRYPVPVQHLIEIGTTWGDYFTSSPEEDQSRVAAISTARAAGIVSLQSAVRSAVPVFDTPNVDEELARLEGEHS